MRTKDARTPTAKRESRMFDDEGKPDKVMSTSDIDTGRGGIDILGMWGSWGMVAGSLTLTSIAI